jgi:hypothetical protein
MLASLLVGGLILWGIWWRITTPPSVVNLAGEDRATRQAECTHAWVVGNERAKRHYCPEFDRERAKLEDHDRLPMSPEQICADMRRHPDRYPPVSDEVLYEVCPKQR